MCPKRRKTRPRLGHISRYQSQLCPMGASQKLGQRGRVLSCTTSGNRKGPGRVGSVGRPRSSNVATQEVEGHWVGWVGCSQVGRATTIFPNQGRVISVVKRHPAGLTTTVGISLPRLEESCLLYQHLRSQGHLGGTRQRGLMPTIYADYPLL